MKQEERSERTRNRIIAAAMEEFGKNGYRGGTINNICRRGINKGLVYHNYRNKDDLYLECLRVSVERLTGVLREDGAMKDVKSYMQARMASGEKYPDESRVFFDAMLNPPEGLEDRIRQILAPIREANQEVCRRDLDGMKLREGITEDEALRYFARIQDMFNTYFAGPAMRNLSLEEKIAEHEKVIPRMLELLLYGIAEK